MWGRGSVCRGGAVYKDVFNAFTARKKQFMTDNIFISPNVLNTLPAFDAAAACRRVRVYSDDTVCRQVFP